MSRVDYLRTLTRGDISHRRIYEALVRRARDIPHSIEWRVSARAREHRDRTKEFRGIHRGERCVVIANGPSLTHTPLDKVRSEITIGLNRVHLLKETLGLTPNYVIVSDVVSQLQHIAGALAEVPVPKFVNWNGRRYITQGDFIFFKTRFRPHFSSDFSTGIYGGHSVTYAALQLAYYLGFDEVVLIGKDHNYEANGTPTSPVISDGAEQNHFAEGYYAPGQMWRIPDYKGEELAYSMAKRAFERDGRRVLDATVGGRLKVFPKVELSEALA